MKASRANRTFMRGNNEYVALWYIKNIRKTKVCHTLLEAQRIKRDLDEITCVHIFRLIE